jgi:hypothetical protein
MSANLLVSPSSPASHEVGALQLEPQKLGNTVLKTSQLGCG